MAKDAKQTGQSPSHARLADKSAYRNIIQAYFAGSSIKGISRALNLKPQTVNRNLTKFRQNIALQVRVLEYLEHEAAKAGFLPISDYLNFYRATLGHHYANGRKGLEALHVCMTQCPRVATPAHYLKRHVGYHIIQDHFPHLITPIRAEHSDADVFIDEAMRRENCAPCQVSGFGAVAVIFQRFPPLYIDLMFYLSAHQVRNLDGFHLHVCAALLISAVRRIVDERYDKCEAKGLTRSQAEQSVARKHRRLVDALYAMALAPPKDQNDALKKILQI